MNWLTGQWFCCQTRREKSLFGKSYKKQFTEKGFLALILDIIELPEIFWIFLCLFLLGSNSRPVSDRKYLLNKYFLCQPNLLLLKAKQKFLNYQNVNSHKSKDIRNTQLSCLNQKYILWWSQNEICEFLCWYVTQTDSTYIIKIISIKEILSWYLYNFIICDYKFFYFCDDDNRKSLGI